MHDIITKYIILLFHGWLQNNVLNFQTHHNRVKVFIKSFLIFLDFTILQYFYILAKNSHPLDKKGFEGEKPPAILGAPAVRRGFQMKKMSAGGAGKLPAALIPLLVHIY